MKIKLIIILVAVLIVVGAGITAGVILSGKNETEEETTEFAEESPDVSKIEIFRIDDISEMKDFVNNNELVLQESDEATLFAVGDIQIAGQSVDMFIQTNEEGSFLRTDGSCTVAAENLTVELLEEKLNTLSYIITALFGVTEDYEIKVYSTEGAMLHSTTSNPLEKVITENACCAFYVVDEDSSYWNVTVRAEKEALIIEFFHSYQEGLYEFDDADLILNEESKTQEEITDIVTEENEESVSVEGTEESSEA